MGNDNFNMFYLLRNHFLFLLFQVGKLPNAEFEILAQEMKQIRYKGRYMDFNKTFQICIQGQFTSELHDSDSLSLYDTCVESIEFCHNKLISSLIR